MYYVYLGKFIIIMFISLSILVGTFIWGINFKIYKIFLVDYVSFLKSVVNLFTKKM